MARWSSSTSTSAAIQWFDVSCSILSFLFDILEISGISSKLVTFVTFYMNFSKILEKANQIKFCANVHMDQFTLHESAVIRWSTYEYEFWIILCAATLLIFPGVPCAL